MEDNVNNENTQEQNRKQYDWLKGYQFVKGQSGNPGGRPKGRKALKTFVKEYLENLPEEEKIEYLKTLPAELVWRMAEGNPAQDNKMQVEGELIVKQTHYGDRDTTSIPAEDISDTPTEIPG